MMPQPRHWGGFPLPQVLYFTTSVQRKVYGFCTSYFPLKYGFIIVQASIE